jgi:hypothetical protein
MPGLRPRLTAFDHGLATVRPRASSTRPLPAARTLRLTAQKLPLKAVAQPCRVAPSPNGP